MAAGRRGVLLQAAAVGVGLLPLLGLGVTAATGGLSANPIEDVTHVTGEFTLRWLLVCLAVTPLRRAFGWSWAAPLRRTFGLLAFFYGTLHLLTWLALDQFFDWAAMWEDVLERRYITVGFLGYLCLLPLAVTSTRGWKRRLGRRWVKLHRLAYVAAIAGVVHFLWLVKADLAAPLAHAAVLAALLGLRAWHARGAAARNPARR
ncbi:MAG: protein-methionine-sulfoxide reductase heme-binding subunit MsrQ [Myxococcota bacterium]